MLPLHAVSPAAAAKRLAAPEGATGSCLRPCGDTAIEGGAG